MENAPARGRDVDRNEAGVVVMSRGDIERAVTRMAHEILERHGDDAVVLVGVQRGGVWIADEIASAVSRIAPAVSLGVGKIDVSLFRDDLSIRPTTPISHSEITTDLSDSSVILVDDVLFTGRTVRAALDALNQFGRPERVQLAVMVDRGHRELPIRPDYVGKNLPTSRSAQVIVEHDGVRIVESPST